MKIAVILFIMVWGINAFPQVAINTDGTTPDNSAMLDVKSTTRGFLAPRMTLTQRNAIGSPATGLIVFQTNGTPGYYYNSGTPSVPVWSLVGSNAGQWQNNGSSIYYNLGNVGIGTDAPGEKLHVDGCFNLTYTLGGFPFIKLNNSLTGGNTGLEFKENDVSKAYIYFRGDYNSLILNADSPLGWNPELVIRNGGNVGIGVLEPTTRLQVIENTPGYTAAFGVPVSPWTQGTNVAIGNDDEDAVLYVGQAPMHEGFLIWQYNSDPALGYYSIGTYNGSNALTLQEYGGNVGIRKTSPAALLHVAEESPGHTAIFGTQVSDYMTGTNVSIGDDNASSLIHLGQSVTSKGYLAWQYNSIPANAYFGIGTYGGSNPLILQEAGGSVGIGTLFPTSKLQVNYNPNGLNYIGYSAAYPTYIYHVEQVADGDGQSNLFAQRSRIVPNDGTGYAYNTCNTAINGYSYWGDVYTFGTSGFNYNDYTRCGGVLGANVTGIYWGSLGYKNSGSNTYGGYFTNYTSGTGKSPVQAETGIGLGAWGGLLGADIHGKVYGLYAEGDSYAMFSNGDVYKNKLDVHLQENGTGTNTVLYTTVSTDVTVQTCGVATLSEGRANITFDPSFTSCVSVDVPVIVTVTPVGNSNGVYLAGVTGSGFTVVENNSGKSSVVVNYIAIGKRAGYENPSLPQEVIDAGYTGKLAAGLHNDGDRETTGQGLYYENNQLMVGVHPTTLPDPYKPAAETVIPAPSVPSNEGLGVYGISTGTGNPGLVQQKASVRQLPAAETAGSGSGKTETVPQAAPRAKDGRSVSQSPAVSPVDRPSENR